MKPNPPVVMPLPSVLTCAAWYPTVARIDTGQKPHADPS